MIQYRIAVCDDEKTQLAYTKTLVQKWAAESESVQIVLEEFASAEAFWFAFELDKAYDILLLDIEMAAMNGVELARKVRAINEQIQIVFITGFPDYMQQGFDVAALHYLLKPVSDKKLAEVLDRAVHNLAYTVKEVFLETDDAAMRVRENQILYAEAFAHSTAVYIEEKKQIIKVELKMAISKLKEMLSNDFIKCHRSYIVNLPRIERITKTDVVMEGDRIVPLSRRMYAEVNQAFIEYHKGGWRTR